MATSSGTVAIILMKPLAQAKTRLSPGLDPKERMSLTGNLLRRVLRATVWPVPTSPRVSALASVWVVGGDPQVCRIAHEEGATWREEEGSDMNESLSAAFKRAIQAGNGALYLPGDLPFIKPSDVHSMLGASGRLKNVTIAPARTGGGTNGLLVPPGLPTPFRPLFGPGSFARHLAQAASERISIAIYHSPGLGFDLDTPEDLETAEYMEPGLREKLIRREAAPIKSQTR